MADARVVKGTMQMPIQGSIQSRSWTRRRLLASEAALPALAMPAQARIYDQQAGGAFKTQRPKLFVWNINEGNLENPPENAEIWGPSAMSSQTFLTELRHAVG